MASGDFHLGAEVRSSDGKKVGKLVHVLVGPEYELRALVVREDAAFSAHRFAPSTWLLADEFIVPRDAVASMSRDLVQLTLAAADVHPLPPYLSYGGKEETATEVLTDVAGPLTASPEVPRWLEQVAHKAPDELEIDGGENVMLRHTGRKLGVVKDVLFDGHQLVGVVLQPEGWFKSEVVLPRRFLERSDDAALFANLEEADLERLTPFRPQDR
jgi:sporulation protein YlmC with PRC-barrel domain